MKYFIEVDYAQNYKYNQKICGDIFLLSKSENKNRIVFTLSDGLGSGVKANVLANLTATMGQKFVLNNLDVKKSANIIMKTLPVCSERKISYSTFSICDISSEGLVKIIEYDNPEYMFFKNDKLCKVSKKTIPLERKPFGKTEKLYYSEIKMDFGDRLIVFSDGVSQSGMGNASTPLGWRRDHIIKFITDEIKNNSNISASNLCNKITSHANSNDIMEPKDDITSAVVYVRKPRKLMIATGPPIDKAKDKLLKCKVKNFKGKKIISGGTTANILSREYNKKIKINLSNNNMDIPPSSTMEGVDLITEGMLTLSKVANFLEKKIAYKNLPENAAKSFIKHLINSDHVYFLVGTKINEAHQDPNIPFDIGIRRTIIKRIATALENIYLKETYLEYI